MGSWAGVKCNVTADVAPGMGGGAQGHKISDTQVLKGSWQFRAKLKHFKKHPGHGNLLIYVCLFSPAFLLIFLNFCLPTNEPTKTAGKGKRMPCL